MDITNSSVAIMKTAGTSDLLSMLDRVLHTLDSAGPEIQAEAVVKLVEASVENMSLEVVSNI